MKKTLLILALFFLAVSCGTDKKVKTLTNESIITLSNTKGMSDNLIYQIISESDTQFKVEEAKDIIYLKQNNVSERVIVEMIKAQEKEKEEKDQNSRIGIGIGAWIIIFAVIGFLLYNWDKFSNKCS
ncbi:hypothetical protein PG275_10405 [Riemerella anatipestifer]|nr:hypothetical protein [Riemerella anatipestifer]